MTKILRLITIAKTSTFFVANFKNLYIQVEIDYASGRNTPSVIVKESPKNINEYLIEKILPP